MHQFLSSFTNDRNPLGQKCAHTCLCLLFYSPECKFECCQIPLFLPVSLSSYPTLPLRASQHYQYLLTLLFIPRNSIHHWRGLEHLMETCGWLHRCLLPVVCFPWNDNHKSNYLVFILQTTGHIRWPIQWAYIHNRDSQWQMHFRHTAYLQIHRKWKNTKHFKILILLW